MLRTLRLAGGAAVLLAASTILAQAPPAPPGSDLFPLKQKSKWVYKVADQEVVVEVNGTEKIGTDEFTKVETKVGGALKATELFQIKSDGVYRVKVKEDKVEPPVKILALPPTKDATWKIDSKVGSQSVKGEFKIKDVKEPVTVPAGKFDAVVVDGPDFDIAGNKTSIKQWFVPGKGIVKLVFSIQGSTESVLELKEYTEGK